MPKTKRGFAIPKFRHQSTSGARRAYLAKWGHDWPHCDAYLRALARATPPPTELAPTTQTSYLLNRMRETHSFPARPGTKE